MKKKVCNIASLIAVVLALTAIVNCTIEPAISNDPHLRLSFSDDTIAFDTLFTHVGSATAAFKILNRTSANIRIADISLAGGWQSPFRVNVDGRYETRWNNVDVRSGDSVWVFVEATLPQTNDTEPYHTQDSLLFILSSGTIQKVLLTAYGWNATKLQGVTLTEDYTFRSGQAYIIFDSLTVAAGQTLTAEPGAVICFHSGACLYVDGTVHAEGTLEKPVIWRGDRLDNLLSNLPYDRVNGQWGGIELRKGSKGNVFSNCDIHSSDFGIRATGLPSDSFHLALENTQIHNTTGNGLQITQCNGHAMNCLFTNAGGHCVTILGGSFEFLHCTFANFYPWLGGRGTALDISNVSGDTICPINVSFVNCLVTGMGDDELSGQIAESADSIGNELEVHYVFRHSLLNSPKVDNAHYDHITWESPDSTFWGFQHFPKIDHSTLAYDFHLNPLSTARGIGTNEYLHICPADKDGILRSDSIDAGCYQLPPSATN